jgi:hypothetical protein
MNTSDFIQIIISENKICCFTFGQIPVNMRICWTLGKVQEKLVWFGQVDLCPEPNVQSYQQF